MHRFDWSSLPPLSEVSDIYITTTGSYLYKHFGNLTFGGYLGRDEEEGQKRFKDFIEENLDSKHIQSLNIGIEQSFSFRFENVFVRAHIFLSEGKLAANFRILPSVLRSSPILQKLPSLEKTLSLPSGLFLIAGATGAGKSTSASHILKHLGDTKTRHIVCIEDPIEYRLSSQKSLFTYREVGRDTQSFESGILSALRQDVDVIFVGELRESTAIESALLASQTGHFVLTTIHGGDASSVILRFLSGFKDMARASYELSQSLVGILMQQRVNAEEISYEFLPVNIAMKTLIREQKFSQINSQAQILREHFVANIKGI